jgi:hypothetical protein
MPNGLTAINLGSTDSQRGGTLAYIGTTDASCNRQISVLGSAGGLASGTILNNSPNNRSLHLSDPGSWTFNSTMSNCTVNLGGSAVATNVLDAAIPNTTLGNASLVVNGSIWRLTSTFHSYYGATTVTNGTLLLDGVIGVGAGMSGDVTVLNNGVLGGIGTNNNNVTVQPNGALSPGDFAIGTLTINGNLTNYGSIVMELNKAGHTQDQLVGLNTLVYGGTLVLNYQPGSLDIGDNFPLFSAATYLGAFDALTPATPGPGLAWDLTGLTNGTLKVIAGPANPPQLGSISSANGSVIISGSGGTAGSNYYVLTSTNVALPMNDWTRLATNVFESGGTFSFTNAVDPNTPQQFFRLQLP